MLVARDARLSFDDIERHPWQLDGADVPLLAVLLGDRPKIAFNVAPLHRPGDAAGADMLFVEAPVSVEELVRVCSEIPGPCLANNVEGGKTPTLPSKTLEDMGFAAVTFPVAATHAVAAVLGELYRTIRRDGSSAAFAGKLVGFEALHRLLGLPALRQAEAACDEFADTLIERSGTEAE